jgi:hypothetical protein
MTNEKDNRPASNLMEAALSGTSDMFIVRETLKRLEGKDTITIKDIRHARNGIFEDSPTISYIIKAMDKMYIARGKV